MKPDALIAEIKRRIEEGADPVRAEHEQRYFKGTIRSHGLSVPKCHAIGRDVYREHRKDLSADQWLDLGERLLAADWFEEGSVGLEVVQRLRLPPSEALFDTYERWLGSYVGNWAHCDDLCAHLIGSLLIELPDLATRLPRWTASENRWLRRGAAVSLIVPVRRGLFLQETLSIAGALIEDKDDLVQKGFGWLLREAAKEHRFEVTAFLEQEAGRMPRTAFRYAIEKFPPDERKRLMSL
jgi:3-methyladenine DNA glycosylase AlkD